MRFLANLALNLCALPLLPFYWLFRWATRPRASWVEVRLRPRVVEIAPPLHALARWIPMLRQQAATPLPLLRELVDHVLRDATIEGVLFVMPPLATGWATASALRDLLVRLASAGKQVVVWLPQGGGNRELYVASAATRVMATPQATLAPLGVAATSRYVKGLLDRVGVAVEVHRRAEFKTAAETAARESMSDEQREQLGALLDTWDEAMVGALASQPSWDDKRARALFDEGILSGEAARAAGIVDALAYEDELPRLLGGGREGGAKIVRAPRYLRHHAARWLRPLFRAPYVAVVPVHGPIVSGPGGARGQAAEGALVSALRAVARDRRARGVILHVDSPGGSALASDLVHREVEKVAAIKPVVACFGDVAASGGYYIAAAASAIVAQPLTITGSIGVIAARVVLSELFESLGVKTEVLRRAPHADLMSNPRALDADEKAILEREVDAMYRAFVGVVARGRKRDVAEIEPLARGRVWSGRDAHTRGLVDALGGLDAAIAEVEKRAGAAGLRAQVIWPRQLDLPPLTGDPKKKAAALLGEIEPAVGAALELAMSGERGGYLAVGLPQID